MNRIDREWQRVCTQADVNGAVIRIVMRHGAGIDGTAARWYWRERVRARIKRSSDYRLKSDSLAVTWLLKTVRLTEREKTEISFIGITVVQEINRRSRAARWHEREERKGG